MVRIQWKRPKMLKKMVGQKCEFRIEKCRNVKPTEPYCIFWQFTAMARQAGWQFHLLLPATEEFLNCIPELMDDFPPRGPPRPRPPETLRPLPPGGRLLLSRWCRLSLSSSPANDQSLSSSFLSDSVSEGLDSSEFVPFKRLQREEEHGDKILFKETAI